MAAPHVYVITDRRVTGGRSLPAVIESALAGAAAVKDVRIAVQLREKDLGGAALYELGQQLRPITQRYGAALFINGRVDVALACGADGVHLGEGALPVGVLRQVAPGLRVGLSTHTVADVQNAQRLGADFVVFGPVFATPSKAAFLAARGLDDLSAAAATPIPVLALGGVETQNVAACAGHGASGVAVIRAVLASADPGAALLALLQGFQSSRVADSV